MSILRPRLPLLNTVTALAIGFITALGVFKGVKANDHDMHMSEQAQEKIVIEDAYIFPVSRHAPAAAMYMTFHNNSDRDDRLVAAEFVQNDLADRLELHTHIKEAGIMRMRKVESFDIPAKGHHTLLPHGDHIMVMAPKVAYEPGMAFDLTLRFEHAGPRTITVPVIPRGEPLTTEHNHEENHHHHSH